MEVVENKNKYVRRKSRWQKILQILRKFIWVFPLLAIAIGLLIAWQLIRNIQAESTRLPGVNYEKYLDPAKKPTRETKKLEQYREKMKKDKEEQITSRYDKIISGSEIVGKVDYGKVIPAPTAESQEEHNPYVAKPEGITAEETNQQGLEEATEKKPEKAARKVVPNNSANRQSPAKQKERSANEMLLADSAGGTDSLQKKEKALDPFYTLRPSDSETVRYTKAHFYGDQDILSGSFIRLRLGEDMLVDGRRIPRNTLFRGIATLSQNKIEIRIDQIGSQEITASICDQDYNPGIVIPASKRDGIDDAMSRSLYQTGSGTAMDLPYEILQNVSQNIIRNKRRKQSTIRINDGYLVYITQTQP